MKKSILRLSILSGLALTPMAMAQLDIRIDLATSVSSTPGNWNNISALTGLTSNLINFPTGAATPVSINGTGSPWSGFFGDDAGAFAAADWLVQPAPRDGAGLQRNLTGRYVIAGLPAGNYRIELVSARTSFNYLNTFTVNGAGANRTFRGSPVVTPWNSTTDGLANSNWLIWNSVTPVAGQITVQLVSGPDTLGILNAMRILSVAPPSPIVGVELGTAAPPTSFPICSLTRFPLDSRFAGSPVNVNDVPAPGGGVVAFTPVHSLRRIGAGWATWSHGYTGDVYFTAGATNSTYTMPSGTRGFILYAEPNPFAIHRVTARASSGAASTTIAQDVDGNGGAKGFGFYSATVEIEKIDVSSPVDYAVGEFSICRSPIIGVELGTAAPPPRFPVCSLTRFPLDSRFTGTPVNVNDVPAPGGGVVGFTPVHSLRRIGAGWATWSHGYTGDVYFTGGATSSTYTMPAGTEGFILYAEPNPFAVHVITARATGGGATTTIAQDVDGNGGAKGFGFYSSTVTIDKIDVSAPVDYAVGEFSICRSPIVGVELGTSAPPTSFPVCPLTRFPLDSRFTGSPVNVNDVPAPGGGVVAFTPVHSLRRIGAGWATWSHGYTGDVYFTGGATSSTYTLPNNTRGFIIYAEPNPFSVHRITATATGGASSTTISQDVDGNAGAKGYGFYSASIDIDKIDMSSTVDYAVGEFSICRTPRPCYPDCNSDGVLDVRDFTCFQNAFALSAPYADCNTDGVFDVRDFTCFQNRFAIGCP